MLKDSDSSYNILAPSLQRSILFADDPRLACEVLKGILPILGSCQQIGGPGSQHCMFLGFLQTVILAIKPVSGLHEWVLWLQRG